MNNQQESQKKHYKAVADDYDRKTKRENSNHYYKIEQIEKYIFENLPAKKEGYDILEIGGGTGIHAEHFLQNFPGKIKSFVLSDLSEAMLEQARKRLNEFSDLVEYAAFPAENPKIDKLFDAIYMSGAMHHFASPQNALTALKKNLKPGGLIIICEPIISNPLNFLRACLTLKNDIGQFNVTHGKTKSLLTRLHYQVVTDRVLHFRLGSTVARSLYPYKIFERIFLLDPFGSMFLIVASARTGAKDPVISGK